MKSFLYAILPFALAAGILTLAGPAGAEPPAARATRAGMAVQVDGALTDAAWETALWQGGFTSASAGAENSGRPRPAAVQTRFKVLYDNSALYVGVECEEPKPEGIRCSATEHDGTVWSDDCVEVFLDPEGEGRYYQHFLVNTRGVWCDDFSADYGLVHGKLWDCAIETAARVDAGQKRWSVEVKLPFGALALGARPGSTWAFNVTRERHAGGALELTSWAPLKGNFHAPKLFGKLLGVDVDYRRFALSLGEPAASVSGGSSGVRRIGVRARLTNHTPGELKLVGSLSLFGKPETVVRAEPVTLRAGAEAEVAFPPLSLRENVPEAVCLLSFADAATGEVVKAAVKRLAAEYRPVAIEVLDPCYRNTLYATQKLENVAFRVALAPDVAARAAAVRWEVRDAAGKPLRQGRLPAAKLPERVTFPAKALSAGRFTLVAEALTAGGEAVARQETPLARLPAPEKGNEVRIDEHRNLLVDGKPFVGIGWYGSVPTEDPRADVVALQNVQTPVVVIMPDVSAVRNAYERHGIRSFVSVENGRLYHSFKLWQRQDSTIQTELSQLSTPSPEMVGYVREMIAAVRGEPGLLGYYIADEPEINNTRSDYLESLYKLLQEEDPYHPVMVTNDTLDGIVTHGYKCADILNPDPYSADHDYVPNFLKKVLEVARRGKATMLTLWHSSSQAHFTNEYGSSPAYPYPVFRCQYLAGIAYGAVGFTAYTSPFFMSEIPYRYGLPYVWREIRFLGNAISAPAPEQPLRVESSAEMAHWIREAGGHLYLILANHKPGAREAKVSHPLLAKVPRLYVASEGREVALRDGAFTDRFAEGDARIYTTDPAARALKTTAAVEAELADRERASAKPGNLLHWSRGTRALASQGYYAPWFHQYYYYVINGITDDVGWCASHAGGKPAWLELALKEPSPVGRLVIHTPNLKDYTVEIRAADGSAVRFAVEGNEKDVVEHHLNPPVPCLKIRVTATAARPGKGTQRDAPQISEIEVYAAPGEGPATPITRIAGPALPADLPAFETAASGPNHHWTEDFRDFQTAERYLWNGQDTKWVLDAAQLRAGAKPGGGLALACLALKGAGMTHLFPYDPAHRFLQVKIAGISGEGYRFINIGLGVSSGAPGYRGGVNTARPGIYTVDTHYIHPDFAGGKNKQCFLRVHVAGAGKGAGGGVRPGPEFTLDWLRLARRPEDGLAVTLADGSPLPDVLKAGDELFFRLFLAAPAADATVEVKKSHEYSPLAINGEPYVQLLKVGAGDGREWAAKVKLGPGTGKHDLAKSGYPVVFRAAITGGAISETYASAFVGVE